MSELFQLIPNNSKSVKPVLGKQTILSNYTKKQAQFLNKSYGYYTNIFIHRIVSDSQNIENKNLKEGLFEVINPQRILKDTIKRFFLTDLQLIFVNHICKLLQWNYTSKLIKQNYKIFNRVQSVSINGDKYQNLDMFLCLVSFYVKNYLGDQEQYSIINDYLNAETNNQWTNVYNAWLKDCPNQIFTVSPKMINRLYRDYTQDCQNYNPAKNYNGMVDKILQLSTTYSMIPGEAKIQKKKRLKEVQKQATKGRKKIKTNQIESRIDSSNLSNLSKIKDNSGLSNKIYDPQQSNNNFVSNIMKSQVQNNPNKKTLLRPRPKQAQVNNHITQFYNKNPSSNILQINQNPKQQSSIMQSHPFPSILNNRSSIYQPIPYTLRNNSNISNFWL